MIVRLVFVVFWLGATGCSSDLVLPESPASAAEHMALTKVNGDDQNAAVGEALKPLVVRVLNGQQQGVIGAAVSFEVSDTAAGTIDPDTATTNSVGEAVAHWTLGSVPGPYTVVARVVGVEDKTAEFHAVADPGRPAALAAQTPPDQPGRREQAVRTPPQVQVLDRFGNPVPGASIAWQVIAGEGRVTPTIGTTDSEGKASATWTLGNRIGVHKLTASADGVGSPVTFTAVVLF
jgi:hypothetical protein